jgi:hypothetical protein
VQLTYTSHALNIAARPKTSLSRNKPFLSSFCGDALYDFPGAPRCISSVVSFQGGNEGLLKKKKKSRAFKNMKIPVLGERLSELPRKAEVKTSPFYQMTKVGIMACRLALRTATTTLFILP